MSKLAKALTAAAGNAGGDNLYVEDVFSTYLYDGNSANRSIENGIDLDGEGGMVWIKTRTQGATGWNHTVFDTERGANNVIYPNATSPQNTSFTDLVTNFNSNGFSLGTDSMYLVNKTGYGGYASWTFRKAEKFFDVVTWTGDGTGARTISHSLNGTVGALFMKATNVEMQWFSYHNGLTNAQFLELNATTSAVSNANAWNNTTPTSSEFSVGSYGNISGRTYVAYLFASDAGGFGDDGSESIIKCGSYTGNGSTDGPEIDLGFEPQWVLIKRATGGTANWLLVDVMRGFNLTSRNEVSPNLSNAEYVNATQTLIEPRANGFKLTLNASQSNFSSSDYIYIAIRRPMKTPESGTEVFASSFRAAADPAFNGGFPVDTALFYNLASSTKLMTARMTGTNYLSTNSTAAENSISTFLWDYPDGWNSSGSSASTVIFSHMFKRATGFFDVVAYTSTSSAVNHNLGVPPELVIYKSRTTGTWYVMTANNGFAELNSAGAWAGTGNGSGLGTNLADVTATTIKGAAFLYGSGVSMITYLFASVAGVSKVGSYTGTGSNVDVDCGFSAGARFILIKRTDSTGDWYVWDSERGIVAGNDPYLLLNSTAAEVTSTDYIDPLNAGFTVTSSAPAALNASGGTYIFLAIA